MKIRPIKKDVRSFCGAAIIGSVSNFVYNSIWNSIYLSVHNSVYNFVWRSVIWSFVIKNEEDEN